MLGLPAIRLQADDCALLIGPAELLFRRREAARVAGLRAALLCTEEGDARRIVAGQRALAGWPVECRGWMGAFTARLAGVSGTLDLGPLSWHADGHFDWVLDFTGSGPAMPPPGYFCLAPDDYPALKQALLKIARYRREGYEHPRYLRLDESLCAHARQGIQGCSACLDVCPTGALSAGQSHVRIEPLLCQGCAACGSVCLSGALGMAGQDTSDSLAGLAKRLQDQPDAGVWIRPREHVEAVPEGWLTCVEAHPSALGLDYWLAALALGARRVAVTASPCPEDMGKALDVQLAVARGLLLGLALPTGVARVETASDLSRVPVVPAGIYGYQPAGESRRERCDAALTVLIRHAGTLPGHVSLPAGAPWGSVEVDPIRCSYCSACARICPHAALTCGGDPLQLAFNEPACVQCGLCVNACPEKALTLRPRRWLVSPGPVPRVLAEAETLRCVECGKAFSTRAMMARTRDLLSARPMPGAKWAGVMELCMDCRMTRGAEMVRCRSTDQQTV